MVDELRGVEMDRLAIHNMARQVLQAVTQAAVLTIFILITLIAVIKFRPPKAQM
jgi:hypothetical protein